MLRGGRGLGRLATQLPPQIIDRDHGMTAFVRVDAQHDHGRVALSLAGTVTGPAGGQSSVGGDATLLSSHTGRSCPCRLTARRDQATKRGTEWLSEPAGTTISIALTPPQ